MCGEMTPEDHALNAWNSILMTAQQPAGTFELPFTIYEQAVIQMGLDQSLPAGFTIPQADANGDSLVK